jgi:hypothetical protein
VNNFNKKKTNKLISMNNEDREEYNKINDEEGGKYTSQLTYYSKKLILNFFLTLFNQKFYFYFYF